MALFFDRDWFDNRMAELGLDRATVAKVLGLTHQELDDAWKDQRELHTRDVALLSALLDAPAEEIAVRAGVSTPVPGETTSLREIEARLARIENKLSELTALLRAKK